MMPTPPAHRGCLVEQSGFVTGITKKALTERFIGLSSERDRVEMPLRPTRTNSRPRSVANKRLERSGFV
jgi:hypothetical protein